MLESVSATLPPLGGREHEAVARLAAEGGGSGEPGAFGEIETIVVAPGRDLVPITAELAESLVVPVGLEAAPDQFDAG